MFSKGVYFLGKATVLAWLGRMEDHYKVPSVSVGAGEGVLEHFAHKARLDLNLPDVPRILVDPHPTSYPTWGQVLMPPNYDFITSLVKDRPDIVGNCTLLCNWALPDLDYDMEAIELLRPRGVLAIYETRSKVTGSKRFREWIRKVKDGKVGYSEVVEVRLKHPFRYDMRLAWIHRNDLPAPSYERYHRVESCADEWMVFKNDLSQISLGDLSTTQVLLFGAASALTAAAITSML